MAARKPALRAVAPGERAARPSTILEAAEAGDRLEELRSMRRRIARTLDNPDTPPRDLAALSRRQMELGREIEALVAREGEETRGGVEVTDGAFDSAAI